ncbi:MAG: alkane 1-monooxygenase [Pseudomonadota bacterium]
MQLHLLTFIIASCGPAILLMLGTFWGGIWAWAGLLAITVGVFFADKLPVRMRASQVDGTGLSILIVLVHFVLFVCILQGLTGALPTADKLALFVGASLWFGQVSNSNAHEMIHQRRRILHRMGAAVYSSLLFGHHASAHPLVHHVHAATAQDPNSAPRGMGFWRYALRAWKDGYTVGYKAEAARFKGWRHPYVGYAAAAVLTLAAAALIGGTAAVALWVAIALYAQLQLLLSDYVQHYGLRRRILPTGKAEPIGVAHSWNAPQWASSAMMLNAPRHSDHHLRPALAFPALELDSDMPVLPHSLPVMAVVALFPPLWRRVMDPRVDAVQAGRALSDAHHDLAVPAE